MPQIVERRRTATGLRTAVHLSTGPSPPSKLVDTSTVGFAWLRPQPPGRRTGRPAAFKIRRGSFAPNPRDLLNTPQRPAEPAQRDDLLFLSLVKTFTTRG